MLRIERISDEEVCVTVEPADQEQYGISYETMCFSDPRIRRFCEQVALLVRIGAPFSQRECDRMNVRAVARESGDLSLFFTLPDPKKTGQTHSALMEFFSADAFLDCRIPRGLRAPWTAEVYVCRGKYYLFVVGRASEKRFDALCSVLSEYAAPCGSTRSFLREHGVFLPAAGKFLFSGHDHF